MVKDWQAVLPPSPLRTQDYYNQCWNLCFADCLKDVAYLENKPLPDEISNREMTDWLPLLTTCFNMNADPFPRVVNSTIWPAYDDETNGCVASIPYISQYLRCYGTHFKNSYKYEQQPVLTNTNFFSMKEFHDIRTSSPNRVFTDFFRLLDSKTAIPVVTNKHPAVGILFSSYPEFKDYKFCDTLSPIRPIDEKTKLPHLPDHMVYIVGYGFVKKGEEKIECFLIKNTWGEDWGFHGLAMVPVSLFESVAYPKGVRVRDSQIVVRDRGS